MVNVGSLLPTAGRVATQWLRVIDTERVDATFAG
jgi:hypothetical protein